MTDLQVLKAKAMKLSANQRRKLMQHLKMSLALVGGKVVETTVAHDLMDHFLTDAIRRAIVKRGIVPNRLARAALSRAIEGSKNYPADCEYISQWIDETVGKLTVLEKDLLADLLISALINYMRNWSMFADRPIDHFDILTYILKIPTAINAELPGYARSGLLKLMVRPKHTRPQRG